MCFHCWTVLLHLGGAGPEIRVSVSLDMLRRLRDVELVDDLTGGLVHAPSEGAEMWL